jgi:hypothetical protein
MTIYKIKAGRIITVSVQDYIGEKGQIFYDEIVGELRLSDGVTPGGTPITSGTGGGSSGTNNLVFSSTGSQRILTNYVDPNGGTYTVRTTELTNGSFILNLAAFTPVLASSVLPSASLNWDVACTGFTVSVTNPADFPAEWISSVRDITPLTGTVTGNTSTYTSTGPNVNPAGGISWQQTFSTNASARIRPVSNTITGGSASARIAFNVKTTNNPVEQEFTDSSTSWSVSWATPTLSIAMTNLANSTFLQTYTQTS